MCRASRRIAPAAAFSTATTNGCSASTLLYAFAQRQIASEDGVPTETPTAGYTLLKAELSRTTVLKNDIFGAKLVTVGVVGNNLLNADIRNHVSYTKDEVLMPGASVRVFASVKY